MALEPAKLSDFTLASTLGSGTTAKVYDAVHTATGRPVAIKVMDQPGEGRGEVRERFAREALLLAGVESRYVGKILGFGFDKGKPFLVLERLAGETLDAKLRRDGPVAPAVALRWIEQLVIGVRDCHDAKVIHRDIKPANIFLHREGYGETVKLIDFGVARLREITGDPGGLTSTNHLIGSMGYMAPEQFRNAKGVGFQADLYAVGVVIYRALSGRLPFVSRSLEAIIRMKSEQTPPPISSVAASLRNAVLDRFVEKALMREPERRFQNAREMLEGWWDVMESFDEGDQTDVRRAAVEPATYVGPLSPAPDHLAPLHAYAAPPDYPPPASTPHEPLRREGMTAPETLLERHPALEDERTIQRPSARWNDATEDLPPPYSVTSVHASARDEAPHTVPLPPPSEPLLEETARVAIAKPPSQEELDDMFDLPTRSDPHLGKLVERELELSKQRKGRG